MIVLKHALQRPADALPAGAQSSPAMPSPGRILLGLAAPAAIVAGFWAMAALPPPWSVLLCGAFYAALVLAEARNGIYTAQNIVLLFWFVCCVAVSAVTAAPLPVDSYAGTGALAILAVHALLLPALGRAAGDSYWQGRGLPALHQACAAIWRVAYAVALAVAAAALPGEVSVQAPTLILTLALAATLVLTLVDFGPRHRRQKEFELGGFVFRELDHDEATLAPFLAFYARELGDAIGQDPKAQGPYSGAAILDSACRTERELARGRDYYFGVFHHGKLIGAMAVSVDRGRIRLPLEEYLGIAMDPLRRYGRIADVRRTSVDKNYRFHGDVLRGLIKCCIEAAMENDVSFVMNYAFHFTLRMYSKIGFEAIGAPERQGYLYGSPMQLTVMNLAALALRGGRDSPSTAAVTDLLNPYLVERWLNRAALRRAWLPTDRQPWPLTARQVETLLVPATGQPAAAAKV